MTVLGNWVVVVALLTSVATTFLYLRSTTQKGPALQKARLLLKLSALSVAFASLILLTLLLRHDFTNGYVYSYSSRDLPLHYLISSFYAGQEGSFLFWALCSALLSLVLMRQTAKEKSEPWVMAVFMGVQSFLLVLLLAKTPFHFLWDKFSEVAVGQVPPDGSGLNPLLQNFWMVFHPPVLFVGFAAMAIPFSYAVAGLWKREYTLLASHGLSWVIATVMILGLGIMLGAYWAYGVLGWGGYWGWDPVENSSLVPWITAVALIHTTLAQRKTGKFIRTNMFLAVVSFFLVIYSTFLTRSGILGDSSVHSFVDPGATVYWLLVAFQVTILAVGLGMLYRRRAALRPAESAANWLSRESGLGAGALALGLSAVVILFGTSLPIVSASTVEPAFYDVMNLPIAILLVVLIGFSLYTQWHTSDGAATVNRAWKSLMTAAFLSVALYVAGIRDWLMLAFAFGSLFAFVTNLEFGWRGMRGDLRALGGKVAHIGLAVFFLGVITTGKYSSTSHVSLPLNESREALGYALTYVGYTARDDGKFAFHIEVEKDGARFRSSPVMFDAGNQGIMRNPDITTFLAKDFYVSPVSLDQPHADAHDLETYTIPKGQTVSMGDVTATFVRFDLDQHGRDAMMAGQEGMAVGSVLELTNGSGKETITPVALYPRDGPPVYQPLQSKLMNATVQLVAMNVGMGGDQSTVTVGVDRGHDHHEHQPETLVVEASVKPFVNLLWAGTVVMTAGFVLSMLRRSKENHHG